MQTKKKRNTGFWEKSDVLKEGYLIKFQRGLVKAPKMRYFVLTQKALFSFACKPDESTDYQPLGSLSFEQLTSLKVAEIELNHSALSCIQITGRTTSNFLMAFSRMEERDEWMMAMLNAYSESLVSSPSPSHLDAEDTRTTMHEEDGAAKTMVPLNSFGEPSLHKRRKRNNGSSLRRTKSYDVDLNNRIKIFPDHTVDDNFTNTAAVDMTVCQFTSRKRKSEPNIHVLSHFPDAWNLDCPEFRNNCFDHRDSLTLLSAKKQCDKMEVKNSIVSKIRSALEHSTRRGNLVKYRSVSAK